MRGCFVMKKISLFIMIALTFVLMIATFPLTESVSAENLDRYGYSLLKNDMQRTAYRAIADGISSLTPEIKFSCDGISPEDVRLAGEMITRDYPEFFWFQGGAEISIAGKEVTFSPSAYKVNGQTVTAGSSALISAKNQLESAINSAIEKLPSNPSQYEIAHTFHDFVVNNVTYSMSGDHQTAYGALVNGKAVCAGYARAFQLLMNRAGIRCWYVAGDSYAPNGTLVAHAWNLYWLNGKCYYSDATWDDQGSDLFHEYLNMSLEEISKTHYTSDALPISCGHNDYTFFIMNDGKGVCDIREHKQPKDVAKCFEIKERNGEQVTYYCTVHYHGDDFEAWLNANAADIIKELGLITLDDNNVIILGHEYHVTFIGKVKAQTIPTDPSVPAPTTMPTEPTPTTKPKEPVPTTKPTESVPTTEPTTPTPTAKPTESAPTTTTTSPTQISESTEQAGTQATGKLTDPAVTSPPSSVAGTKEPAQSNIDSEGDTGTIIIMAAACLMSATGIVIMVYFFVIKKK